MVPIELCEPHSISDSGCADSGPKGERERLLEPLQSGPRFGYFRGVRIAAVTGGKADASGVDRRTGPYRGTERSR